MLEKRFLWFLDVATFLRVRYLVGAYWASLTDRVLETDDAVLCLAPLPRAEGSDNAPPSSSSAAAAAALGLDPVVAAAEAASLAASRHGPANLSLGAVSLECCDAAAFDRHVAALAALQVPEPSVLPLSRPQSILT
jgi:hypothetical protein